MQQRVQLEIPWRLPGLTPEEAQRPKHNSNKEDIPKISEIFIYFSFLLKKNLKATDSATEQI